MARKMQIEEFLRYVAIPLFGFGIVGAAGPRCRGVALGRASAEKTNLYWFTATPFEQNAQTKTKMQESEKTHQKCITEKNMLYVASIMAKNG